MIKLLNVKLLNVKLLNVKLLNVKLVSSQNTKPIASALFEGYIKKLYVKSI